MSGGRNLDKLATFYGYPEGSRQFWLRGTEKSRFQSKAAIGQGTVTGMPDQFLSPSVEQFHWLGPASRSPMVNEP